MSRTISVELKDDLYKKLKSRADKNYQKLDELIEDIIRRSMLSYKKGNSFSEGKNDDKLIGIFSRSSKGRKRR
jgi:metal-responsive CopG/Arc/MetJ family transcriptional regulator